MTTCTDVFFSWTLQRVMLPRPSPSVVGATDRRSGLSMDHLVQSSNIRGRLLVYHDAADDTDYVALLVGEVLDASDVPMRFVPQESLLLKGNRSFQPVEILVGVDDTYDSDNQMRILVRQLWDRGPIWSLLRHTGARSITVEWHPAAPTATPGSFGGVPEYRNRPWVMSRSAVHAFTHAAIRSCSLSMHRRRASRP